MKTNQTDGANFKQVAETLIRNAKFVWNIRDHYRIAAFVFGMLTIAYFFYWWLPIALVAVDYALFRWEKHYEVQAANMVVDALTLSMKKLEAGLRRAHAEDDGVFAVEPEHHKKHHHTLQ